MIVDLVTLEKGLKAEFNRAYASMAFTDPYARLAASLSTVVKSNANNHKYGFLGDVPVIKEWLGDKTYGILEDYDYTITNKDWYTGIGIDRNEIEDDQMGMVATRIQMMAQRIKAYQGELVANLIINGTTNLAYDATAFFANRTAPNDNLLGGTGTTLAQMRADLYAARAAMMKFQTDTGHVMGMTGDIIVVPPEMEGVAFELRSSLGVNGADVQNPIAGWIKDVIVLPNATDADDWYLFSSNYPLKPFIYQDRKSPVPVLDEGAVKRNRALEFSAEMRGDGGYGLFHMGVKTVN
mgnify:CR=1 FL=1